MFFKESNLIHIKMITCDSKNKCNNTKYVVSQQISKQHY